MGQRAAVADGAPRVNRVLGACVLATIVLCAPAARADSQPSFELTIQSAAADPAEERPRVASDASAVAEAVQRLLPLAPHVDRVVLRRLSSAEPSPTPRALLLLAGGDRLAAESFQSAADDCTVAPLVPVWGPQRMLPVDRLRGAVLAPLPLATTPEPIVRLLERSRCPSDVLLLTGGDRVSGELLDWSSNGPRLRTAAGDVAVAASRVQALAMNAELVRSPDDARLPVIVWFEEGTLLSGRSLSVKNGQGELSVVEGPGWPVPWGLVRQLEMLGPRTVCLSQVRPESAEWTPFLPVQPAAASREEGAALPSLVGAPANGVDSDSGHRIDRNAQGGPLVIRGARFLRGIGVRSHSNLTFALPAAPLQFRATVGIDDEARGGGAAMFAVEIDGRRAWTSPVLRGVDPPLDVQFDIDEGRRISLIVEYGPAADINDLADWGAPRLVPRVEP